MLRTALLLLCFHQVSLLCVIDNRSTERLWERELLHDIFCNYDDMKQPNNVTKVQIRYTLKSFSFDYREEEFTMNTWMFITWDDPRLKWNVSDYEGIDLVYISPLSLWIPPLSYKNSTINEEDDIGYFYEPECQIHSNGKILCVARLSSSVICITSLVNWPYDTQTCTFKFGTNSDKVKLSYMGVRGISMLGAEYGIGWDIIDYKQEENSSPGKHLSMTFLLERHAEGIVAINVFPSIAMTILTLSAMFLKIDNTRVAMLCFSLGLHFTVLTTLLDLPHYGTDTPSLSYFTQRSMFVTSLLLALTIISQKLIRNIKPPPLCIVSFNEYFSRSYLRYGIWPRWVVENDKNFTENELDNVKKWNDFTNIMNSVCIVVMPVMYLIMYIMYMPRPSLSNVSFNNDGN